MDVVIPVITILLAALVHATLQISLGCLLLLYHASKGRHLRKKTSSLVRCYVGGIGVLSFLGVSAMCFCVLNIWHGPLSTEWLCIIVGVLLLLTVLMWLVYYRWNKGTELWIPKVIARFLDGRAKVTNNKIEAFSLGVMTCFAELPFSLVLFVVTANSVLMLPNHLQILMVVVYAIATIIPMVILCTRLRTGTTVVEVQRWRIQHKNFFRIMTGVGFLILAVFIIGFQIQGAL